MTTAIARQNAIPDPRSVSPPRSRPGLVLAGFVVTLAAVSIAAARMQPGGASANDVSAAAPASAWMPAGSLSVERLEVVRLKRELVRAGYSIRLDGSVGPVTKSALADYLQPDAAHPLSPFLVQELRKTVITGRRNPTAWNDYFGVDRRTRFVERPLTGPGGQLDANGNLRAAAAEG